MHEVVKTMAASKHNLVLALRLDACPVDHLRGDDPRERFLALVRRFPPVPFPWLAERLARLPRAG